jgi:hypothetical protein
MLLQKGQRLRSQIRARSNAESRSIFAAVAGPTP